MNECIGLKRCYQCQRTLPVSAFCRYRKAPDGLNYLCRDCSRAYRLANRDRLAEKARQWYLRNQPEQIRRSRERYQKNRVRNIANATAKQRANPEYFKAYWRRRYLAKRDEILASNHQRYLRNRERYRAVSYAWTKANPDKERALRRRREARLRGAVIRDLTAQQWQDIKEAFDQRCAYCGEQKVLTQDHVIPLSKGGNHTAANVVPACRPCNSRKADKVLL